MLAFELITSCMVYALIIAFATIVVILIFTQELELVLTCLVYALLVEGGLALVTGGIAVSFSPTIGRIAENVFHKKSWDAKLLRSAERQAQIWIATGTFLVLMGLLVSAL